MKDLLVAAIILTLLISCKERSFTKAYVGGSQVYISDSVVVRNGHDEEVKVFFSGIVPNDYWEEFVKDHGNNEKEAFALVCSVLSMEAKYRNRNDASFEPDKKQGFLCINKSFNCHYKSRIKNEEGDLVKMVRKVTYNHLPHS